MATLKTNLVQNLKNFCHLKIRDEQFEAVVTVILRVPGYFVLDYWSQHDIGNCIPRSFEWPDVVSSGFAIFNVIQGILILLLPLEQLVKLYMHYLTVATLAAADRFSHYYTEGEKQRVDQRPGYGSVSFQGFSNMLMLQKSLFDTYKDVDTLFLRHQVSAIVFHTLAASLVSFFLDLEGNKEKILLLVYLVPVFARLAGFPASDLHLAHNFSSCFVIFLTVQYIFLCVPKVLRFLRNTYDSLLLMHQWYGFFGLVMTLWERLFQPMQVLIFWMVIFVTQLYQSYTSFSFSSVSLETQSDHDRTSGLDPGEVPVLWYFFLIHNAAEVCSSPLTLAGLCVTVSYISSFMLGLVQAFLTLSLASFYNGDANSYGLTEGMTMVFLSIQTSILSLDMPERAAFLTIILLIVFSSLVYSMYEQVEPLILALSVQGLAPLHKHIRAIILCIFLLLLPIYMVYMFIMIFEDFWFLLVVPSSIMTPVQVMGLIVTYILLTWDAVSTEPWPGLDDLIYYARATTRVFEFLVAVFLVASGVNESVTGRWSLVNFLIVTIHCYFNVWLRLQQGWQSFLLRLNAAKKISSLPKATLDELREYDDVCAICYSQMTEAAVTKCKHLFHRPCLRKWLYVQHKCPLCHTDISLPEEGSGEAPGDGASSIEDEIGNNIPLPDTNPENSDPCLSPVEE